MRSHQDQDIREVDLTDHRYKHGDASPTDTKPLYRVWANMKLRCYNVLGRDYPEYGGKGIRVYRQWLDYLIFREWAKGAGYVEGLVIFREDSTKDFNPDNCIWLTREEATTRINGRRRRFIWAEITSIRESNASMYSMAKVYGVTPNTIAKIIHFKTYQKEITDNGNM